MEGKSNTTVDPVQLVECPRCAHRFELSETFRAHFEDEKRTAIDIAVRESEAGIRSELEKANQAKQEASNEQIKSLQEELKSNQQAQEEREAGIRAELEKASQAKQEVSAQHIKTLQEELETNQQAQEEREAGIRAELEQASQAKQEEDAQQIKNLQEELETNQQAQEKREAEIRAELEKANQAKQEASAQQIKTLQEELETNQQAQEEREAEIRAELEKANQAKQEASNEQIKSLQEELKSNQQAQEKREAEIRAELEQASQAKQEESAQQIKTLQEELENNQQAQEEREAEIRAEAELSANITLVLEREENQIERKRLERQLSDAQRQLRQKSVELQGEALEVYLKRQLQTEFPFDAIDDIGRGRRGADLTHLVRHAPLGDCGIIVWEAKRTKHWNDDWIEKIKQDAEREGTHLRIIVSEALPKDISVFALKDGVWVSSIEGAVPLANALRSQLIESARLQRAAQGKHMKMDEVYLYLTSPRFGDRIQRMVETWSALEEQVVREERAMQRQWKERRKQLAKMQDATIEMFTDFAAILGQEIAQVPGLELEALPPGENVQVIDQQ